MEFWNNVFEFNRSADVMTPLAMQSVDTGMGMERITTILKARRPSMIRTRLRQCSNASNLFPDIQYVMTNAGSICVIADHMRSLTFVLSEGGQLRMRVGLCSSTHIEARSSAWSPTWV